MQGKLKDKILLIVSAIFFFAVLFGWYGSTFPVRYESKTTLILKPPTISTRVVRDLTEEDLLQRLQSMNQQILSRETLEPMIFKYKLFEIERAKGMPIELIIERMQKNIRVEPTKDDSGRQIGFSITYRDTKPENARNVATELAGKYVNLEGGCNLGVMVTPKTTEFYKTVIENAKDTLKKIEKERAKIKKSAFHNSNLKEIEIRYQEARIELAEQQTNFEEFKMRIMSEYEPQGETIRIVDSANLPQSPIYPTTMDLTLIGAGFGLIASLFLLGLGSGVSYLNEKFGKVILQ